MKKEHALIVLLVLPMAAWSAYQLFQESKLGTPPAPSRPATVTASTGITPVAIESQTTTISPTEISAAPSAPTSTRSLPDLPAGVVPERTSALPTNAANAQPRQIVLKPLRKSGGTAPSPAANPSSPKTVLLPPGISIPLALVDPEPELELDDQQTAQLEALREKFVKEAGEIPLTGDALNRRRWLSAQSDSDQRFKALFGWSAFNAMQLKVAQQAAASP